jgi:hypothetical protein
MAGSDAGTTVAPDLETPDLKAPDFEIAGEGKGGTGIARLKTPTGETDDSNAGAADGITRCNAGIARDATNTAVQAASSNFE